MKKKQAPEQYAAKPKVVTVKPSIKPPAHPAAGLAHELVRWLARGGVPPSVILLHGLHLARTPENDGLPVDTHRPQLKMQGTDSKAISEILDALARPQADKHQIIAAWLQTVWVKKHPVSSRVPLSPKKTQSPARPRNPAKPPKKSSGNAPAKPVIVIKKKT